jgi:membrane fusion protein, multidrug efflux system
MSSASAGPAAADFASSSRSASEQVRPAPRVRSKRRVLLLLAALGAAGFGGYAYTQRGIESTDNAQIDADVLAVPARVSGVVARVSIEENQSVQAGELLAEIDPAPYRAKLAQAEAALLAAEATADGAAADAELARTQALGNRAIARANLATNAAGVRASNEEIAEGRAQVETAQAALKQAELDRERAEALLASGTFSPAQREQAQTAYELARTRLTASKARLATLEVSRAQSQSRVVEASARLTVTDAVETLLRQAEARAASARAQVEVARAARDLANLELSYTQIRAPIAGIASRRTMNPGQMVATGQAVVQLVPGERWVVANFKETQVGRMHPGQHVRVQADAFPDLVLEGEIESFSGATGAKFTLLPPDNATGNFTKIVQRVPVRIRLHGDTQKTATLRPGMSVEVEVETDRP